MGIALGNKTHAALLTKCVCGWKLLFHPSRILHECVGTDDYPGEIQHYFAKCVLLLKWAHYGHKARAVREGWHFLLTEIRGPIPCTCPVRAVTGETQLYGVAKPNQP